MNKSELLSTYTAEQPTEEFIKAYNGDSINQIVVNVGGLPKIYTIKEIEYIVGAYEDIKYCKEHDGEHLRSEEYLKIISLNREVAKLESVRKTKQCEIEELKKQLDRSQTTIAQIDEILKDLFGATFEICETKEDFDGYKRFLEKNIKSAAISDFLPAEPIKVADMLISSTYTRKKGNMEMAMCKAFGNNADTAVESVYSVSELRQIAEHLLIYCNANVEVEE